MHCCYTRASFALIHDWPWIFNCFIYNSNYFTYNFNCSTYNFNYFTYNFNCLTHNFNCFRYNFNCLTYNFNCFTYNFNYFTYNFNCITYHFNYFTYNFNCLTYNFCCFTNNINYFTYNFNCLTYNFNSSTYNFNYFTYNFNCLTYNFNYFNYNFNYFTYNFNCLTYNFCCFTNNINYFTYNFNCLTYNFNCSTYNFNYFTYNFNCLTYNFNYFTYNFQSYFAALDVSANRSKTFNFQVFNTEKKEVRFQLAFSSNALKTRRDRKGNNFQTTGVRRLSQKNFFLQHSHLPPDRFLPILIDRRSRSYSLPFSVVVRFATGRTDGLLQQNTSPVGPMQGGSNPWQVTWRVAPNNDVHRPLTLFTNDATSNYLYVRAVAVNPGECTQSQSSIIVETVHGLDKTI